MPDKKFQTNSTPANVYDDGNIPDVDLPQNNSTNYKSKHSTNPDYNVEPLPESSRPRKDGPGGD